MTEQAPCPNPAHWKELLEGSLPANEQSALHAHLEVCLSCQQTLESLAAGSETWSGAARHLVEGGHGNEAALQRVMAELEAETDPPTTQTNPQPGAEATLDFLSPPEKPDQLGRLGHYTVTEVIGRGGMGIVLKAVDEKLHRVVAIKVMAPQLATNADARKRFSREAQAAAAVRNEHVIDIHAVEEANGLPYLVMEYVSGPSLQERLDQTGSLDLRRILRIGMQTAAGLAAAHAQGLIHRDIKPANILLENGVERVKITDFGLARAVDDASLTHIGVVAGTPLYMAPEQARGEPVDHRADLFSLGSVLYALCTGRPPFRAGGTLAILKRVSEDNPRPVREVNPEVPNWLAEIIAKLHAKDPARRFPSAAEVAELLSQHLAELQQPSLATTPSGANKLAVAPCWRRWTVTAGVLLCALAGLGLTETVGVTRFTATVIHMAQGDNQGVKVRPDGPGQPQTPGEIRRFEAPHRVYAVTFSPDGKQVLSGSWDHTVRLWEVESGRELRRLDLREGNLNHAVYCVAISPNGQRALAGVRQGTVWLLDLETGKRLGSCSYPTARYGVNGVAFSPDGSQALLGSFDGVVRLWDVEGWKEVRRFNHPPGLWSVDFSPSGRMALTGGGNPSRAEGILCLWDLESGQELRRFEGHTAGVWRAIFSPNGRQVLSASEDRTLRLWEVETGKELRCFTGHSGGVQGVAFSPDGRFALSGSHDRTMRLWDVATGKELYCFEGHTGQILTVAYSPNGRQAVSGSNDDTLRLWQLPPEPKD